MIKYPLNVTIDTNIFEANKFDFGTNSTMSLLIKNVRNGKIKLVLSNIVISEVEKHICQRVDEVCRKARKLRKEYLSILPEQYLADIGMGIYVQIPDKKAIHERAKDVFAKFLEDCEVERLDTANINLEEILEDYFATRPPFENSEKKRKEFPDAFIAEEIKKRFGNDQIVAIVSQDKGFRNACTNSKNHLFFSSLGELFDTLNKNEKEYTATLELINSNNDSIVQTIKRMIDDSNVEVHGLSNDRDGIVYGYDYNDIYLEHCYLTGMKVHAIDDIDGDIITASLWIHGNVSVNCYFEDFSNAIWDSEENDYVCVKERHILEKHNVRFPCRIKLNSKTKEISVIPFKIVLGEDSIKNRVEIDDEQEALFRDFDDINRENLGFLPLSKYNDMLENSLNDSNMAKAMIKLFAEYNDISTCYEKLASQYDEICIQVESEMEGENAKKFITALSKENNIPIDFSEKNTDILLDKIREWLDGKLDMLFKRMERNLPDYIEYGEYISFLGRNCKVYTLHLEELHENLEVGSEEQIEVTLLSSEEILARGFVKLTVGYLTFDEDGGASDGTEDSIVYEVDNVLEALKDLISDLNDEFLSEQKLAKYIMNCLKQRND